MFPSPQSALPLPPRPSLERYKKIAKDLVKACRSADEADDGGHFVAWASDWVDGLMRLSGLSLEAHLPVRVDGWIEDVAAFGRRQMRGEAGKERECALADAQFVIARSHGFESWPKFVRHLESVMLADSSRWRFESAADAIVAGDLNTLKQLLDEDPALVRMRSAREHEATLLHYVSANGVEGYRQTTPGNVVEIAAALLRAGAEVDAIANVYGGGATALGLTATSGHPERAGVQEELMRLLLDHGARLDASMVRGCLHNGRGKAAVFLADLLTDSLANTGAGLGLAEAAGVGRLDLVQSWFADGDPHTDMTGREASEGFLMACQFGRDSVVEFLLGRGVDPAVGDGQGQTGLHHAVIGGHIETVKLLLRSGTPMEVVNSFGGTALGQALWSAAHGGDADVYIEILKALTAAGATLPEVHVAVNPRIDAWLEARGSAVDPRWYWYGEKPRRAKVGRTRDDKKW